MTRYRYRHYSHGPTHVYVPPPRPTPGVDKAALLWTATCGLVLALLVAHGMGWV